MYKFYKTPGSPGPRRACVSECVGVCDPNQFWAARARAVPPSLFSGSDCRSVRAQLPGRPTHPLYIENAPYLFPTLTSKGSILVLLQWLRMYMSYIWSDFCLSVGGCIGGVVRISERGGSGFVYFDSPVGGEESGPPPNINTPCQPDPHNLGTSWTQNPPNLGASCIQTCR